jgi:hypothetical protein
MAEQKYPHEIAIQDTVGGDTQKLPLDLRRKIGGFNSSAKRSTNPDDLMKQSHILANEILDWDEKDLPEEPQGDESQQSQSNGSTDTPADGSAADSHTQDSTQNSTAEGQTDTPPQSTDSSTQTSSSETDEPEFIEKKVVKAFSRVGVEKVPNPKYKPKS